MTGLTNYPPGVTGAEPYMTGEQRCNNCGARLPEEPLCPECEQPLDYCGGELFCLDAGCPQRGPIPVETCPGGCP